VKPIIRIIECPNILAGRLPSIKTCPSCGRGMCKWCRPFASNYCINCRKWWQRWIQKTVKVIEYCFPPAPPDNQGMEV
jgi:hypothetical protein